jgi:hypothetical protein
VALLTVKGSPKGFIVSACWAAAQAKAMSSSSAVVASTTGRARAGLGPCGAALGYEQPVNLIARIDQDRNFQGVRNHFPQDFYPLGTEISRDVARRLMRTNAFPKSRDARKRVEMRFAHLRNECGSEVYPVSETNSTWPQPCKTSKPWHSEPLGRLPCYDLCQPREYQMGSR